VVQRGIGTAALERLTPDRLSGTTYTDAAAPAATTLRYRIRAVFANGQSTLSNIASVTTPSAMSSTALGDQKIERLRSPTAIPSYPVVPDTRAMSAAPVNSSGAGEMSSPSTAPAVSGRYRIVANGFSVIHETAEDLIRNDGKSDEVYGGFLMFHFDRRDGTVLDRDLRRTKALGDITNFPDRLRAGSASATGGLRAGDSYPDAAHARSRGQDGTAPNDVTFPFKIWEGTLTNATDAVILLPTLWEQDQDGGFFENWANGEVEKSSQIWWDPAVQDAVKKTGLGVIAPPGATSPNPDPNFATKATVALTNPWLLVMYFAPSHDMPIGLGSDAGPGLPRRAIVLTREIIEHALSIQPTLPSPAELPQGAPWLLAYFSVPAGVIPVLLMDRGPPNQAPAYVLYLQVERV
jgi:hypothetical protein